MTRTVNKNNDFTEAAWEVLRFMQKRDYRQLDVQMQMANDYDAIKDLSFGRLALRIPQDHLEVLKMLMPDITAPDAEIQTKAWKAFTMMDESLPYKPNAKARKM